jgi:transcriptional regulator with XRE-family HTH domain
MTPNEKLVELYLDTGLKKVDFARLIGKSDSYVCDLLKGVRNLSENKLFEITAVLKMKEIKVGAKVKLITKEYKKTDKYNPRDLQGEVTDIVNGIVFVTWANGLNNVYEKNKLIIDLYEANRQSN